MMWRAIRKGRQLHQQHFPSCLDEEDDASSSRAGLPRREGVDDCLSNRIPLVDDSIDNLSLWSFDHAGFANIEPKMSFSPGRVFRRSFAIVYPFLLLSIDRNTAIENSIPKISEIRNLLK